MIFTKNYSMLNLEKPFSWPYLKFQKMVEMILSCLIRFYQHCLSGFLGGQCRYEPSCSNYALEAIDHLGPWMGFWLALKRIGRCHPLGSHGFDPVPRRKERVT